MDIILSSVKWQFTIVYLDDIVTHYQTLRHGVDYSRHGFTLLKEIDATFQLKECALIMNKIYYLGLVVLPCRFEVATKITDGIRDL